MRLNPVSQASTPEARAAEIAATEPSPFFPGQAGTRIGVLWDLPVINLEIVKALLLVFDKIALIGRGERVDAPPSERDQWQVLVEMGLVAQVTVADTVAVIDTNSVQALFDVLLARDVVTRSKNDGPGWRLKVAYGAFRRLGEPEEWRPGRAALRDGTTLEIVSTVICWMFEEAIAARGVSVHDLTTERATVDAFTKVATGLAPAARTVTLPCEWVLPPCSEASVEQLMDFRAAAGPSYRRYLDRVTEAMTSLSRRTDATAPPDSYSPDQLADEVYTLRRLMRDLPWLGRGYVGLGFTGNAGLPRLRDAQEIVQTLSTRRTMQMADVRPRGVFMVESARASWI